MHGHGRLIKVDIIGMAVVTKCMEPEAAEEPLPLPFSFF